MRLIDVDELKDQIIDEIGIIPTADMKDTVPSAISFVNRLNMAPTIDAVPVVRCRECKWGYPFPGTEFCLCNKPILCHRPYAAPWETHKADWYCGDGERKEDAP